VLRPKSKGLVWFGRGEVIFLKYLFDSIFKRGREKER